MPCYARLSDSSRKCVLVRFTNVNMMERGPIGLEPTVPCCARLSDSSRKYVLVRFTNVNMMERGIP